MRRPSWLCLVPALALGVWTIVLARTENPFSIIHWVNIPFHEAGHVLLMPFGRTLHILGGTLGQLAVPAILAGYFLLKQRGPFSAAVCFWWFGENIVDSSFYMADARALKLDLIGGGEHDWNNLFYDFGLLGEDSVALVSTLTHHVGVALMLLAIAWMAGLALPAPARAALGERHPFLRPLLDPAN